MSPTSTDGPRFRRAFTVTVIALAVLCAVFLALGYLQGPKLSSAQVDARGVVTQSGQQLRLFANQPLAPVAADQVTVTPATPVTVSSQDDVVSVQFDERLRYATEYRVIVAGVTSAALPQASTLEYTFTTQSPTLYYLDRGTPDDEIVSTGLSGSDRTTVYSAPRIQDFAVLTNSLAVVTLSDSRTSSIDLVSPADGVTERLPLPDEGVVERLDAASSGSLIGFTLTSAAAGIGQQNSSTLYTIDVDATRVFTPVPGLDGAPLRVLGWQWIPGTNTLVALSTDQSLLLVDPTAGSVTPLGQFQSFDRVSPDGLTVTMADQNGPVAVTIADGSQKRLTTSDVDGQRAYPVAADAVAAEGSIQLVSVPAGSGLATVLVDDDGASSRVLYRTVDDAGSISDFSVSPNGQYVAIETVPDDAANVSDGYYFDARSTSVTTVIVDVDSGAPVRSVEGFRLTW